MKPEVQQPRLDVLGISIVLILISGILAISAILMLTPTHYSPPPSRTEVPADAGEPDAQAAPNFLDALHPARRTMIDGKLVITGRCVTITFIRYENQVRLAWADTGETTVVLRVDSEAELLALAAASSEQDLPHYLVRDEGRTEFGGMPTYTCLGIGPANSAEIDLITGKLPRFR